MNSCGCSKNCRRKVRPDGLWSLSDMIGAEVKIASLPGYLSSDNIDASRSYTIADIKFRVTLDGKTITLVYLDGINSEVFALKDLEIVTVKN